MKQPVSLSVSNLSWSLPDNNQEILKSLSFDLEKCKILGVVGPNGAGKSTLLRLLQGQNSPDKGKITIDGKDLPKVRYKVALMPQRSSMNWKFPITVEKLISLGKIKQSKSGRNSPFQINELLANPNGWVNKCCELEANMQRVGISKLAKRRLDSLSGGQQQRALLAKTLMSPAKIFLLDEPCAALDPPAKEDFIRIIRQLADAGTSVFISSHDWGISLNNYDEVIVLDKTVIASGKPQSVQEKLKDINISNLNDEGNCN